LVPVFANQADRQDGGLSGWRTFSSGHRIRVLLVFLFGLLVVARMPQLIIAGRFWAEEGLVYFAAAWHQPWTTALLADQPGYLNFTASAATTLARHLVPLELAPRITTFIALIMQLLPAVVLATSRIAWLQRWPALAAALLLLLIPAGDAEVWLNSITSQFHLALCVALILAVDTRGGAVGILHGAILVLAPLTAPVVGSLGPLFLLRTLLDRSWARLLQTVLLGLPMLVQVAAVLHAAPTGRGGAGPLVLLAALGLQHVILPFIGQGRGMRIAAAAVDSFQQIGISIFAVTAGLLGTGALAAALWRWGDRTMRWLFVTGLVLALVSYSAAITLGDPFALVRSAGNRYTYAPTVLFSLSLLGLAVTGPVQRRGVPAALILWMILVGGGTYFAPSQFFARGPDWRQEVAAWRLDPSHKIVLWPQDWRLDLGPEPQAR
jgi:hypothetical protein